VGSGSTISRVGEQLKLQQDELHWMPVNRRKATTW